MTPEEEQAEEDALYEARLAERRARVARDTWAVTHGGDLIDFPCSDAWLDHYASLGMTPRFPRRATEGIEASGVPPQSEPTEIHVYFPRPQTDAKALPLKKVNDDAGAETDLLR